MIHTSYYDACDVSCDVIYYVIAVRARRMVRIFFLPYLGNRSKSDPYSYELFCFESHILSFPKVLQIAPESSCVCMYVCMYVCMCMCVYIYIYIYIYICICIYTGCPRRNVPNFGRVFLMLNYTDITQNTYIQS